MFCGIPKGPTYFDVGCIAKIAIDIEQKAPISPMIMRLKMLFWKLCVVGMRLSLMSLKKWQDPFLAFNAVPVYILITSLMSWTIH